MTDPGLPDIRVIRDLLLTAFDDKTLRRFCYDRPTFQPLMHEFASTDGLSDLVDKVISYCLRFDLFDELLDEVEQYRARPTTPDAPGATMTVVEVTVRARDMVGREAYEQAIRLLKRARQAYPYDPEIEGLLLESLYLQGVRAYVREYNLSEARMAFKEVLALDPFYKEAARLMGEIEAQSMIPSARPAARPAAPARQRRPLWKQPVFGGAMAVLLVVLCGGAVMLQGLDWRTAVSPTPTRTRVSEPEGTRPPDDRRTPTAPVAAITPTTPPTEEIYRTPTPKPTQTLPAPTNTPLAPTNTPATSTPAPTPWILLEDDFDEGTQPGAIEPGPWRGWDLRVYGDAWWTVGVVETGNHALCVTTDPGEHYAYALYGSPEWVDYALQVDVWVSRFGDEGEAVLQARDGEESWYEVQFEPGTTVLYRQPGEFLDQSEVALEEGWWHGVQFEVQGAALRVWVDDGEILMAQDEAAARGGIRLGATTGAVVCFDNVRVVALGE